MAYIPRNSLLIICYYLCFTNANFIPLNSNASNSRWSTFYEKYVYDFVSDRLNGSY